MRTVAPLPLAPLLIAAALIAGGCFSVEAYDAGGGEYDGGTVQLSRDSGAPPPLLPGFETLEQQVTHLTHPVQGWYWRTDERVGTYTIWHDRLELTGAQATRCRFALYERLEIATREELAAPHSALICPETYFEIHMPPRVVPGLRRGD